MAVKKSKYDYPLNVITAYVKDELTEDEIAKLSADEGLNKKWSDALDYLGYNERNKEIVEMYCKSGLTLRQVGEHFGISGERVRDIAFKTLERRIRFNEDDIKYLLFNGLEKLQKRNEVNEILIADLPIDKRLKLGLINSDIQTLKELRKCDPLHIVRNSAMDMTLFKQFSEMMDNFGIEFDEDQYEQMKRACMLNDFYNNQSGKSESSKKIPEEPAFVNDLPVEDMPISTGAKNVFLKANIHSLRDMMECDPADIAGINNMNYTFMKEYINLMERYGMPVEKDQVDQMKKIIHKRKQMPVNKVKW